MATGSPKRPRDRVQRDLEHEDHQDVAAIEEAMRDPRPAVPWEKVKAELGI